jgi:hypothetical protein
LHKIAARGGCRHRLVNDHYWQFANWLRPTQVRELQWDPNKREIIGETLANSFLARDNRKVSKSTSSTIGIAEAFVGSM